MADPLLLRRGEPGLFVAAAGPHAPDAAFTAYETGSELKVIGKALDEAEPKRRGQRSGKLSRGWAIGTEDFKRGLIGALRRR